MAEATMGPDAQLLLDTTDQTHSLLFNDGNGSVTELAWSAPNCPPEKFKWMANSLANFHHIPLVIWVEGDAD